MVDRKKRKEIVPKKLKICGKCGNAITARVVRSINKILHCDQCFKKVKEAEQ